MILSLVNNPYIDYQLNFIYPQVYLEIEILLSLNFGLMQVTISNIIFLDLSDLYLSKNLEIKSKFFLHLKPFLRENDILEDFFPCRQQFRFSFSFIHLLLQEFLSVSAGIIVFSLIFEATIVSFLNFERKKGNISFMINSMEILKIFSFINVIGPILDGFYLGHIILFMSFKRSMINSIIKLMIFLIDLFLKF